MLAPPAICDIVDVMMPHAGRRRRRRIDETGNGRTGTHAERAPPGMAAVAPEERRLALLERAVGGARILLLVLDADGGILLAEGGGVVGLGLTPQTAVGRSGFEVCGDDTGLTDAVRRALAGEAASTTIQRDQRELELSFETVGEPGGRDAMVLVVGTDVTAYRL